MTALAQASSFKILKRDDGSYERVVMAEVLIPDTPNVYGDIYTREAIKEFVYEFAKQGYGIDIEHSEIDVQGSDSVVVVESFIARAGDPDFIEGSWVVGMLILDDDLWQDVLDGNINGYSYQALCQMQPVIIENLRNRQIVGVTEPDLEDGHTHDYLVIVDALNRPISGGTGVTNGHSHRISTHTVTDEAAGHVHRFQTIPDDGEENDESD